MFLNKIYENQRTIKNNYKHIELFLGLLESTFKKPAPFKTTKKIKHFRKIKIYKYQKLKQSRLRLKRKAEIFRYVIGLKKTSTNLYYSVTKINGEVILSNTKNRILSKIVDPTQNPNTRKTDLYYLLKALRRETKRKMKRAFSTILYVQNFRRYYIKKILRNLSRFCNIKALVVTNANPHNGCRPPKIKTNTKLRFRNRTIQKKIVIIKNDKKKRKRRNKNPNIIYFK
jgi:hypothetical protein